MNFHYKNNIASEEFGGLQLPHVMYKAAANINLNGRKITGHSDIGGLQLPHVQSGKH